jgi:hypothetical protein
MMALAVSRGKSSLAVPSTGDDVGKTQEAARFVAIHVTPLLTVNSERVYGNAPIEMDCILKLKRKACCV